MAWHGTQVCSACVHTLVTHANWRYSARIASQPELGCCSLPLPPATSRVGRAPSEKKSIAKVNPTCFALPIPYLGAILPSLMPRSTYLPLVDDLF